MSPTHRRPPRRQCRGRTGLATAVGAAGVLLLMGCGPRAELTLRQPFAPHAQQNLKLVADRDCHTASGDDQATALAFALPGAVEGPRAFVVYVIAPGRLGRWPVTPDDPQGVRGFLIQEVGALAGRSDFAAGTIRHSTVLFAPRLLRVDFDVRTADGAELTGHAVVEDDPKAVQAFEREFAGDIALLRAPTSQPAEGEQTAPRAASTP